MPRMYENLVGRKYGMLTVIEYSHTDSNGETWWLCECDCGNTERVLVRRQSLRQGMTTSCGCKLRGIKDDLTGRRFGRLTVIGFAGRDRGGRSRWTCICDCGEKTEAEGYNLKSGQIQSCGCLHREIFRENVTSHGMSDTRMYRIWAGMRQRCENENMSCYKNYGGRGISICDEWDEFENFRDWSLQNGYADDLTIDREDNNLGYCPENCRWVDNLVQQNNTRRNRYFSYDGKTKTIAEWSRLLNVAYGVLRERILRGDLRDFDRFYNK